MNQDQVWSQVQEELRFQLAKRTYDMWLKNTSVLSTDNNTYRIGVPSKLAKDWLADRFSGLIQETLQAVPGVGWYENNASARKRFRSDAGDGA